MNMTSFKSRCHFSCFLFQVLSMKLEEVSRVSPIPAEAYNALWECIVRITNRTLLEGFASARRCTNEGRSLMQLDYQVISQPEDI